MVSRGKLLLLVALAVAAIVGFVFFRSNESAKVRRQFRRLAECVEKTSGEGNLAMVMKSEIFARLFAPECDLEFPEEVLSGSFTPEQLAAQMVRGRAQFDHITLAFYDFAVAFPEPGLATVSLTARFRADRGGERVVDDFRELSCELRKLGGKWRFQRVTVVQTMVR